MVASSPRHALYYPFHLCHDETLRRLLTEYAAVHFRDFMALQLTRMKGLTAYADRMGDRFPELIETGRVVQGYNVSGPLDPELAAAIDRDLADDVWRRLFHDALVSDRRFQRGLFDVSHAMRVGESLVPGPAALLRLLAPEYMSRRYTVERLRDLADRRSPTSEEAYDFEYGLALVTSSASLVHTVRLADRHGLEIVTDSKPHFDLLERTCAREQVKLANRHLERAGY